MQRLENYTLQTFLNSFIKELKRENESREYKNIMKLNIPFAFSSISTYLSASIKYFSVLILHSLPSSIENILQSFPYTSRNIPSLFQNRYNYDLY